jgi:DNA-binding response OmpR family regulator
VTRPLVHLVDDDPDAVELLATYLEHAGIETAQSLSGREAMPRLSERPPDLVLMDVQMPGLDGFETLAAMRAVPQLRDVPVIFLSSLDRPNLKVRALDLGADDYVVKPFNSAELVARVRAVLRRGRRSVEPSGVLEGDLARVHLPVLLQTLALFDRTATVRFPERRAKPANSDLERGDAEPALRRLGLWAWVLMANGRFHGARFGPHRDSDALARLLLCRSGRFETELDQAIEPIAGEGSPIDGLVLRLLVDLDEATARLTPLGGFDALVRPAPGARPELQVCFAPGKAATPRQILIRSSLKIGAAAAVLAAAWLAGEIELVQGEVASK